MNAGSKLRFWGYKKNFMLNSAEHEIFPAHKMPIIFGILTFVSGKNSITGLSEHEKS